MYIINHNSYYCRQF